MKPRAPGPAAAPRGRFGKGFDPRRNTDYAAAGRLGGRPSKQYLKRLKELEPLALRTLWKIMKSGRSTSDKLDAAKHVLDRLHGRPVTPLATEENRNLNVVVRYKATFADDDVSAAVLDGEGPPALPAPGAIRTSSSGGE